MDSRILITGGQGQLAYDLKAQFATDSVLSPSRSDLDIRDAGAIAAVFESFRPTVVINTAAFHRVDACEADPESSFAVNAAAPQRLAAGCRDAGALLVHISTDYVFAGDKCRPYRESDPINPLSVYGASKAAGEMAVRCTLDRHLIVRTTGLYGIGGRFSAHGNFVERMLQLAEERREISVVADQVLTPSYTRDVAASIAMLIEAGVAGTFHVTNSGHCSWFEFATQIFCLAGLDTRILPTSQAERPQPARRPAYSVLGHERLISCGLAELRPWQEALDAYIHERGSCRRNVFD
ncbi:MAG TPA: dTDP-4-dehydrorhamnose reductase [Chloroflexota bacterium]